jgi:two-component system, chemotaxis family, CheB/CheR fusion protein
MSRAESVFDAAPDDDAPLASEDPFEALLLHVKETRGFDFTGYKRSSLTRRVGRRMEQIDIASHADYLEHLELNPGEFTALFNTILINVTSFFRDSEAWTYLRTEVLPPLIAAKPLGKPLRVWSAGCASGEEAYTLAMVLCELLGPDDFRNRVKIYATDVDEEGLAGARQASYAEREISAVPAELRERYFEETAGRWVFRADLRRSVIFGRNDLVQDAPISRIDLLVCRNTLMYFTAETQARILSRFHFALSDTGVLFLGKAEMLLSHGSMFRPIDLNRRVFRKLPPRAPAGRGPFADMAPPPNRTEMVGLDELRHETLLTSPLAQVVVTTDGIVALINRKAEVLFGASARDVGRPFRDLDLSYRPVELRQVIEQAQFDRRPMRISDIRVSHGAEQVMHLDIEVTPLVATDSRLLGVSVVFDDVSQSHRLQEDLEQVNRQLETAYEELQSANEELETTNEELQSTVEELETTNEELQSTNEELETMNEELRSTNDELQVINDQLHVRTGELDSANEFLETILTSLRAAVIVLGGDLTVRVWNRQAQELWGLRREETVGEHFFNLDIGLPVDQLRPMIRRTLAGELGPHEIAVPAVNRRGRTISVRIFGTPLRGAADEAPGVILLMDHEDPAPLDDDRFAAAEGNGQANGRTNGRVDPDKLAGIVLDGADPDRISAER